MGDEFHELGDEFHTFCRWIHIFFTFFTSPHLDPCRLSSFEILVKLSIYNVFNRTTYINLF